jgi:hypothetical protein
MTWLGCGSGGSGGVPDARPPRADTAPVVVPDDAGVVATDDTGVDDPEAGISSAAAILINDGIINPPDERGGGSVVTRVNPVPYASCK